MNSDALSPNLNVLLLSAGYGTRLKKRGQNTPKGLFKNGQKLTITDMMLAKINQLSTVKNIAMVSNHRFFDQYRQHLETKHPQQKIKILDDGSKESESRLGSLGDLVFALDKLDWWQQNVMVLPSDRTPEDIVANLVATFVQHPESFITCVYQDTKENIKLKSGCAELDKNNRVINFEEKPAEPKTNLRGLPFYIFPAKSLALIKKYQQTGHNMDSPGNIVPWLLENNYPVHAYVTKTNSFDIGDLVELARFEKEYWFAHPKKIRSKLTKI